MKFKIKSKGWVVALGLILFAGVLFYIVNYTRIFKNSPNVIIILTDDMDMKLLPYVPKTNALIGEQGATFTNYFITTPICCPSRSSMLRGQYSHNTDILENSPGFPRFFKRNEEAETLAVWLNREGYQTALIGKYLNGYPVNAGRNYVPPGWTEWRSFIYQKEQSNLYYDYIMNENGPLVQYGSAPEDYSTDVIREKSINFINNRATDHSPFFLLISVFGPHGPTTPAPADENLFEGLEYPQTPSFHEADLSDKPKVIRDLASNGDDFDIGDANNLFKKRAQTLQSIDRLVEEVVQTLKENGQLENTYIIFASDNGFHMGEHSVPSGKGTPYEEDIRVPFMIRGPGIEPNTEITQMTANIDLAPTIAELTDSKIATFVDGRSFASLLGLNNNPPATWRKGLLIEIGYGDDTSFNNVQNISFGLPEIELPSLEYPDSAYDDYFAQSEGGSYRGIRTENFVYVEYDSGELEFYDLTKDPYQLENAAATLDPAFQAQLHATLELLKSCEGEVCRSLENELNFETK